MRMLIIITLLISGCGGGFERCEVSGTVLLDGKPVGGAYVGLRPSSGPGTGAETLEDGTFTIPTKQGPMPGNCEFTVTKTEKKSVTGSDGRTADVPIGGDVRLSDTF